MTRSDSDRHGEHRSEGEAAFDALLARAVDMPTDEAALAARIAARIADRRAPGRRPGPGSSGPRLTPRSPGRWLLRLRSANGGAGWLTGRSDALLALTLALGSGNAILTFAAAPAGGV